MESHVATLLQMDGLIIPKYHLLKLHIFKVYTKMKLILKVKVVQKHVILQLMEKLKQDPAFCP